MTVETVRKDHLIDELLDTTLGFYNVDVADIWVGECMFMKMKSKPSLGRSYSGCWRTFLGLERASAIPWIVRSEFPTSNQFDCRLNKSFQLLATTWLIRRLDTKNESFTQAKHGIDYAQSVAGSKLLQCLEKTLSNISLSKLGAKTLRALSKILLFTMSVVKWLRPRSHSSLVSLLYLRVLE